MAAQHALAIPRPDQRGPHRTIVEVRSDAQGTYPTFDCGHTGHWNYSPMTKAGDRGRCFACSDAEWAAYSAAIAAFPGEAA